MQGKNFKRRKLFRTKFVENIPAFLLIGGLCMKRRGDNKHLNGASLLGNLKNTLILKNLKKFR